MRTHNYLLAVFTAVLLVCCSSTTYGQNTDIWNAGHNASPAGTCRIPLQCALGTRFQYSSWSDLLVSVGGTCSAGQFVSGIVSGIPTCTAISPSYVANPPTAFNSAFLITDNTGVGQWGTMAGDLNCTVPSANSMSCTVGSIKGFTVDAGTPLDRYIWQYRTGSNSWVPTSNALASFTFQNQGTTTTVLHGNAAGAPSWVQVTNNDILSQTISTNKLQQGPSNAIMATDNLTGNVTYTTLGGSGNVLALSVASSVSTFTLSSASVLDVALANAYSGTGTCSANTWVSTLNRNAAGTCTQPGFSNLSGTVTSAQLPTTAKGWTYTSPNISLATSTDSVAIGTTTPTARLEITSNTGTLPTPPTGTMLHIGNADATASRITLDGFGAGGLPGFTFRRSLGTAASRTALGAANTFGSLYWQGAYDATNYSGDVAQIGCETAEAFTSSAQGTNCFLSTVHTGGTTLERRWVIDSAGHEVIATTTTPPTVACTGTGTSPSAPTITGTDLAFTINMPTGTGSPANTGTCTVTFGTAFITNMPILVCTLQNGASAWGIGSGVLVSTKSLSAPVLTWWDEATAVLTGLTVSSSYQISCRVDGKSN